MTPLNGRPDALVTLSVIISRSPARTDVAPSRVTAKDSGRGALSKSIAQSTAMAIAHNQTLDHCGRPSTSSPARAATPTKRPVTTTSARNWHGVQYGVEDAVG
jgi:hypothetical protein